MNKHLLGLLAAAVLISASPAFAQQTVDTELATPAALADNTANPTVTGAAAYMMCFDGSTWDRCVAAQDVVEDAAETAGGTGPMVLSIRRDAAASSAGTTGDNATFNTDANGLLWTRQLDPCTAVRPTTLPVSAAADAAIITAVASNRTYICGGVIAAQGTGETINIWEGTGTACGTGSAALVGSTTEANGIALAANGGFIIPSTIPGLSTNVDVCIRLSSTNRVAGYLTYVQAP